MANEIVTSAESESAAPYTKRQAKEHDAELAAATAVGHRAWDRHVAALERGHHVAGDRKGPRGWGWGMTADDMRDELRRMAAADAPGSVSARAAAALQDIDAAVRDVEAANAAIDRLEDIWRHRGRWSRFFIVPGGHIHSSPACHTLRPTTRIGWLPDLSGESEAEAVAAHGAVLCTHCFPSAPVAWTTQAPQAPDPSLCPGSGRYVPNATRGYRSGWGTCTECGATVSVTSLSNARKHKKPEANP